MCLLHSFFARTAVELNYSRLHHRARIVQRWNDYWSAERRENSRTKHVKANNTNNFPIIHDSRATLCPVPPIITFFWNWPRWLSFWWCAKRKPEQRFQSRLCGQRSGGNFSWKENQSRRLYLRSHFNVRAGFNGRPNYSNFHPKFCCCFDHRAARRKRKWKAENGVWNCASRQPPTFIDLGTRIYHPSK